MVETGSFQNGRDCFESKQRDATDVARRHIGVMMESMTIDDDTAWRSVLARDRQADGRFVTGVLTTGIYCRPSCAARHPKRENVRFFADGGAARATGLRACLRCRPDEIANDEAGIARAIALIEVSEEPPSLEALAEVAGYSPFHFHRIFRRATGVTPAAYARAARARRAERALREAGSVTEALYDAGYAAPARFYAEMPDRLGMTPSAWRDGGRGETIRWATAETDLGPLLVAATARGICRVAFEADDASLRTHFPNAAIEPGGGALHTLLDEAVAFVTEPGRTMNLPLDVQGTAFQQAVWRELARIPSGETLSYAALAARAGKPGAARAAGSACGANPVALLIPCHRAKRADGSLGGYAYGLPLKEKLLERERSVP
jgi:AraC family transcriptional regulator of adaptative response/methylated-DNA-[protein]-cysteine methyltransferase